MWFLKSTILENERLFFLVNQFLCEERLCSTSECWEPGLPVLVNRQWAHDDDDSSFELFRNWTFKIFVSEGCFKQYVMGLFTSENFSKSICCLDLCFFVFFKSLSSKKETEYWRGETFKSNIYTQCSHVHKIKSTFSPNSNYSISVVSVFRQFFQVGCAALDDSSY